MGLSVNAGTQRNNPLKLHTIYRSCTEPPRENQPVFVWLRLRSGVSLPQGVPVCYCTEFAPHHSPRLPQSGSFLTSLDQPWRPSEGGQKGGNKSAHTLRINVLDLAPVSVWVIGQGWEEAGCWRTSQRRYPSFFVSIYICIVLGCCSHGAS